MYIITKIFNKDEELLNVGAFNSVSYEEENLRFCVINTETKEKYENLKLSDLDNFYIINMVKNHSYFIVVKFTGAMLKLLQVIDNEPILVEECRLKEEFSALESYKKDYIPDGLHGKLGFVSHEARPCYETDNFEVYESDDGGTLVLYEMSYAKPLDKFSLMWEIGEDYEDFEFEYMTLLDIYCDIFKHCGKYIQNKEVDLYFITEMDDSLCDFYKLDLRQELIDIAPKLLFLK